MTHKAAIASHAARCTAAARIVHLVKESKRQNTYYVSDYIIKRGVSNDPTQRDQLAAISCTCKDWEYRSGALPGAIAVQAKHGCKHMIAVNYMTGVVSTFA